MALVRWLTDRWQEHVRPHVSSARVSATCDVIVTIALIRQWLPWS
ncbi:hypothetical protein [Streptomyces cupreus]|nr:hypothetical protein [Streptomyces cupreus]